MSLPLWGRQVSQLEGDPVSVEIIKCRVLRDPGSRVRLLHGAVRLWRPDDDWGAMMLDILKRIEQLDAVNGRPLGHHHLSFGH